MGFLVVPTSGQLQVPGSKQSFARVLLDKSSLGFVTRNFTATGEPDSITPSAGYIAWKYSFQGASRYGMRMPIQFVEQFIPTDIPGLQIEALLVVLRSGVSASVSIRRFDL